MSVNPGSFLFANSTGCILERPCVSRLGNHLGKTHIATSNILASREDQRLRQPANSGKVATAKSGMRLEEATKRALPTFAGLLLDAEGGLMSKHHAQFAIGKLADGERGRWTDGIIAPEPIGFTLQADFHRRISENGYSMHRLAVHVPATPSAAVIVAVLQQLCDGHFAPKTLNLQFDFSPASMPDHAREWTQVEALWRSGQSIHGVIDSETRVLIDSRLRHISMIERLGFAVAARPSPEQELEKPNDRA